MRRPATDADDGSPTVAHLVPALFGPEGVVGGAERYALELAKHMAGRTRTTLVTFGDRHVEDRHGALRVVRIGHPWLVRGQASNPFAWSAIREVLRADVIHCHQQHILSTTVAALAGRATGRRTFCTDLGGGGWDFSAYVDTTPLFHGHLHISEYSRAVFGHARLRSARVIYGGVDAGFFSPGPTPMASIDCLYVGRLLPHKGVDVLLEAVPAEANTVVIGPAPHERYLRDLHAIASGKRVTFHHGWDDAAVRDAYRAARCVILPSLYTDRYGGKTLVPELLGQTLLEAMACGVATIATDVASLPEIVRDGVTGRIVGADDRAHLRETVEWMIGHRAEAREMGRRGRLDVLERFSWYKVVQACLEAYADAVPDRSVNRRSA